MMKGVLMRLTKPAWTWIGMGLLGLAVMILIPLLFLQGQPTPANPHAGLDVTLVMTGIWVIAWTLIGSSTLRRHGRRAITKAQEEAADAWHEQQRIKTRNAYIQSVRDALPTLRALEAEHGDIGT